MPQKDTIQKAPTNYFFICKIEIVLKNINFHFEKIACNMRKQCFNVYKKHVVDVIFNTTNYVLPT